MIRTSILAVFSLLLILLLEYEKFEFLDSFAEKFNDTNFAFQTKTINPDVVIVAVDEKSINYFGRWPWDRDILAQGLEKLQSADVVALDMVFSESSDADQKLATAIETLNNSVCGFFLREKATQHLTPQELDTLQNSSLDLLQSKLQKDEHFLNAKFAELNVEPILDSCTMQGAFTTVTASDQLYRWYPTAFYLQNSLYPSLALQSLRLKFNSDLDRKAANTLTLGKQKISVNDLGFVRLNFYDKQAYKTISFVDLYKGKIKSSYLQKKIVLFGVTEMGIGDVVATPMGNMYGVYLHATFLSNFLNDELIKEFPLLNYLMTILTVLSVFLVSVFIKKLYVRIFTYIGVYLFLFAVAKTLFSYNSLYIDMFYPLIALGLNVALIEFNIFYIQEKDTRFIKKAFSSYLSKELLEKLVHSKKGLELGGEKKELSILFSDIRNFTTLSEEMDDPQQLIKLLNRYFTPMTEAVMDNKGMLDKYIGDAVMAFFNAPIDVEEHAKAACTCALEMINKLNILNQEFEKEGIAPIHIGIGINTGEVVVGNMGAIKRFNYTIIGDSVNLASRLESKTKEFGVEIIISSYTYELVKEDFECKDLGFTPIKGKKEEVRVYQLISHK
ncbi:adenylate/guanylate cyclase domain-containing protein [Sulfurimonas sp. C5]|uniref:adenylate/guanylate cyclase domain-containing protein n=1 Tax=Sulfurimonas sp. C5 TaxID=3036947 RepID=UPI002458622A|nr:adenylate/guanylate cyclase domain-containing protein [Sulfurimonas sp. C5]MDH4944665.1 adenylate/guanylate cyclase domain-containing protein [Sulfurimonas sp. C5]